MSENAKTVKNSDFDRISILVWYSSGVVSGGYFSESLDFVSLFFLISLDFPDFDNFSKFTKSNNAKTVKNSEFDQNSIFGIFQFLCCVRMSFIMKTVPRSLNFFKISTFYSHFYMFTPRRRIQGWSIRCYDLLFINFGPSSRMRSDARQFKMASVSFLCAVLMLEKVKYYWNGWCSLLGDMIRWKILILSFISMWEWPRYDVLKYFSSDV